VHTSDTPAQQLKIFPPRVLSCHILSFWVTQYDRMHGVKNFTQGALPVGEAGLKI